MVKEQTMCIFERGDWLGVNLCAIMPWGDHWREDGQPKGKAARHIRTQSCVRSSKPIWQIYGTRHWLGNQYVDSAYLEKQREMDFVNYLGMCAPRSEPGSRGGTWQRELGGRRARFSHSRCSCLYPPLQSQIKTFSQKIRSLKNPLRHSSQ